MRIKWIKAATIAQCIQAAGVIVTLGFIVYQLGQQAYQLEQQAYQLQQQAAQARAANVHSLAELMIPITMKLVEPGMAELWEYGPGNSKGPDDKEQAIKESQYKALLASYLIFYENVSFQYQSRLLPDDSYEAWNDDLEGMVNTHPIENYWYDWRTAYHKGFREHVDELVKAKLSPSPSPSASRTPSP